MSNEEISTETVESKGEAQTLWTKNFTIITLGTAVSMFGNVISGFATGLLVLDFTGSVFLFAIYMILYDIPRIVMPQLIGPVMDKFSRRKTIYTLDFMSSAIYAIFGLILLKGEINFVLLTIGCAMLGTISSIYTVAYDSFYPLLITEGNMSKAYSISSTMESLLMIVTPLSIYLYHKIGIAPLFFIDCVCYFIAAVFETQIKVKEEYVIDKSEKFGLSQYKETFREGIEYLKLEPGLMAIACYFMFSSFSGGASMIIGLPYFRGVYGTMGEYIYILVGGGMMLGRLLAGVFHYRHKLNPDNKFKIAFIVYISIAVIGGSYLYTPVPCMMILCFATGVLGMTSYNIRLSATQAYVPHEKKGRFNGTFQMMSTFGMLSGEFLAGAMADHMDKRLVLVCFAAMEFSAAWVFMYRKRKDVKNIYNRET
ncbi:MAG: MFS transporter [Firmicutes bacterium]|nr:MFS transporter [Bacillota bacterium]